MVSQLMEQEMVDLTVLVVVEPIDNGEYLAYCDDLHVVASGADEAEALANIKTALSAALHEYGDEALADLAHRKVVAVDV